MKSTIIPDKHIKRRISSWIVMGLIALLLVAITALLYLFITDRIINSSLQSAEELAHHDEASIQSFLDLRLDTLEGIGAELRQTKCETTSELLALLRMKAQSLDCYELALYGDDGNFYNDSLLIYQNADLQTLCIESEESFVERYDQPATSVEKSSQCLVFGAAIRPFTVEGITYNWLVCRIALSTLTNELKIDSYNGQGYSSVIDRNGDYLVSINQTSSVSQRENLFEQLASPAISTSIDEAAIRDSLQDSQTFTVTVTDNSGTRIMQFTPMANSDWYFITSISRSVFEEQSMDILSIVIVMLLTMVVTVGAVLVLMVRSKDAQAKAIADKAHQQELSSALELAEQANRAKTVFLSSMSHDIRTPMNAIVGFSTLATTHTEEPDKIRDYLQKIQQSSDHLLSLINDVLDMSRIESGKVTIEEGPQDLAEMLTDVRNIIQPEVRKRSQKLYIDLDENAVTTVYIDRLRTNQVLLNLLSNAAKFTPDGGQITITARQIIPVENGQATYQISVADTGIGMSPEFTETVFESFTREQTSTVSGIQGTGLGMSIAKNIMDLMGGTIEVDSTPGKGSTFTITITLRVQEDPKPSKINQQFAG